jgi:cell division protein FtsB
MGISRKAKREFFWIIFIMVIALQCYLLVFADGGYLRLRQLSSELEELKRENLTLKQNQRALIEKIQKLKTDPDAIERKAREEIDVAKPGDIIINIAE